ncbi:AfsR/SARP family transcriptional regulator [Nocardia terpenica]|uniref:AfsR/SARP family transcriptional regulator n=1 Tax=Nocardia terpenica TaxID=455432 RepID=UPI002FE2605A
MSGRLEVGVLGPLRATVGGAEAPLAGTKLRSMVALLALDSERFLRRDELIEELGLADTTKDAVNALHAHVARLRRWLHENGCDTGAIETVGSGYRLAVDRSAVDAHRFTDGVTHALAVARRDAPGGLAVPSVVATMLEDALSQWRGDPLVDVADGPRAAAAADELRRLRTSAREVLLDAWLATARPRDVALAAPAFIEDDPLDERLREQFILALQHLGRHAEAVAAYRSADHVFRTELGISPGPGLRTLLHTPPGLHLVGAPR